MASLSLILTLVATVLIVIALGDYVAPKVGLASPLLLLAIGVAAGFVPGVGAIEIEPELILHAVLPPLLYAAAAKMPVRAFKRELGAVAILAVALVVICATSIGLLIHVLIPAISLPWGIALGAVLSPTDAVAVSIARGSGVSERVITILEGEGLFNDASALVLLSAAISAALQTDANALNPMHLGGEFLLSVLLAIGIGILGGLLSVRLLGIVTDQAAHTTLSFAVPIVISLLVEHVGGSGLVGAVAAGLAVSTRGPRFVPAASRRAAAQSWHTVELIIEGGIFLAMGLQTAGIIEELRAHPEESGLSSAVLFAVLALVATIIIRAIVMIPVLSFLGRKREHGERRLEQRAQRLEHYSRRRAQMVDVEQEIRDARELSQEQWDEFMRRWQRRMDREEFRLRQSQADIDFYAHEPLGPREGIVLVWAGMRGAITLAAAQTLPLDAPMRTFLLFVALSVATLSLVGQGLTLKPLIALIKPAMAQEGIDEAELKELQAAIADSVGDAGSLGADERSPAAWLLSKDSDVRLAGLSRSRRLDLAMQAIQVQRVALLDIRDEGLFSVRTTDVWLAKLDFEEIFLGSLREILGEGGESAPASATTTASEAGVADLSDRHTTPEAEG